MWSKKDLLGISDLSKAEIMMVLERAKEMRPLIDRSQERLDLLNRQSVVTLFYENSTRTKMSFALAAEYLGATAQDLGIESSSVKKGESLLDTGVTLDQMGTDFIIMRHGMTGAPHLLARNVNASVISGGDGTNEHPTQALLDFLTMYDYQKSFQGMNVTIVGDITHSRVARSNLFGLVKLGANVTFAGPSTMVSNMMKSLGAKVTNNVTDAIKDADVVMGLRVQLERQKGGLFPDLREYHHHFGVTEEMLSYAKKDALIMHPGPVNRGVEMTSSVIDHPRSVINEQVKNGLAVRMAVLSLINEYRMETRKQVRD